MSLDFAIIPTTSKFFGTANEIKSKLTNSIKCQIDVKVDTDTDIKTQSRIQKWKKRGYNIVFIDEDYDESNSIVVTFSEKGSRPHPMLVDEFIDIVSSYESDSDNNDENKPNTKEINQSDAQNADDKQDETCIIM